MENAKGTLKRKITEFEVNDFSVGRIMIKALLENGYDIVSEPKRNDQNMDIGEKIIVYRNEVI